MKCRALHTSASHPMKPAMRYVASTLNKVLKSQNFLIRDSAHLVSMLKNLCIPEDAKLIKFDIHDYFMSGKHNELIATATKNLDDVV